MMRRSLRVKLMVLVMIMFFCISGIFYMMANQPAQGEFNYDTPVTATDFIDYGGGKMYTAEEGMTFVTLTIFAKNTSGNEGYSTNPYKWVINISDKDYECHYYATYNNPSYTETHDIVDTDTFVIVYEIPSFTGKIQFSLHYNSNFRAAYNPNLTI